MSTQIEDRLSAALRARAAQVTPADLAPPEAPTPALLPWRRSAAYVAVAAGIAAAVAVPVVLAGHDDRRPAPVVTPTPEPSPTARLPRSGFALDIDGDGQLDKVRLGSSGGFTVFLAADPAHPLVKKLTADTFVTGAAQVGAVGDALVIATADEGDPLSLTDTVWTVRDGSLTLLPTADGAVLTDNEFGRTFVRDGLLYTSVWDGNSPKQGTIRVPTSTWTLTGGVLTPTRVDMAFCTDPSSRDVMPAPCGPGQAPALGAKTGLPTIYPTLQGASVADGVPMDLPGGGTLEVSGDSLVAVTSSGRSRVPLAHAGLPGALSVVPMNGDRPPVYLVMQESGDAQLFSAYRLAQGRLTRLADDPTLPFLDGAGLAGTWQRTWQSAADGTYTAVSHDPTDTRHFTLFSWGVVGDRLTASEIGPVCLDLTNEDYGDCSR